MASNPSVVLVHGAWADGSSWSEVIRQLQQAGHQVTAVQLPLTALADDIAATQRVLRMQEGPTVLAGHSYGGAVITAAATDQPNVIALVYVAAFAPDEGETLGSLSERLGQSPGTGQIRPGPDGFLWLNPDAFPEVFAADVDRSQAKIMAAVQKPLAAGTFGEKIGRPAWRQLPSWYLVAENDQMIPPSGERWMAERMRATLHMIPASHAAMVSRPDRVVDLVRTAARANVPATAHAT